MTFTATVTGSAPTGTVTFNEGVAVLCNAVPLAGGQAQCSTSALTVGSHSIVASYSGDAANAASVSTAAHAGHHRPARRHQRGAGQCGWRWPRRRAPTARVTRSTAVNNNERAGVNWGNGGGWNDATSDAYPDWVQINFNGSKSIDRVVVYTLQDNYANPIEPTDSLTFTQYGITDFTVQGWNGSAWVTLATVSGNNLVKRSVTFAAFTTDRIRVNVTNALARYSRITEIEAWGVAAASLAPTTTTLTSAPNPGRGRAPA